VAKGKTDRLILDLSAEAVAVGHDTTG
jgi:hypothetical protein